MESLLVDEEPLASSFCDQIDEELASSNPLNGLATLAIFVGAHRKIPPPATRRHRHQLPSHHKPHPRVVVNAISSLEFLHEKAFKKLSLYIHGRNITAISPPFSWPQNCKRKRTCLNEEAVIIPNEKKKKRKMRTTDHDCTTVQNTNKKKKIRLEAVPTRDLPDKYRSKINELGGEDIKFVIEKILTNTDVNSGESRLSMPPSQIKNHDFLTPDETQSLLNDKTADVAVTVLGPNMKLTEGCKLKRWRMLKKKTGKGNIPKSNPIYALTTKWNDVVDSNLVDKSADKKTADKKKAGETIQVWSFRVNGHLYLALVVLLNDDEQENANHVVAAAS